MHLIKTNQEKWQKLFLSFKKNDIYIFGYFYMASIRIKGCKINDINKIVHKIKNNKNQNYNIINAKIEKEAYKKADDVIDDYDISNCLTIINTHSNSNIFEAIKKSRKTLDFSNEVNFYREIAFPYLYEIIYYKIHAAYYNYYNLDTFDSSEIRECSICLDTINGSKDLHITKCNHSFHNLCYFKYIKHKNNTTCPNCRQYLFSK